MLNPNHGNCIAKIGQAAFNPAHFVPGIGPSPDQMWQGRLFFLPNDSCGGAMRTDCEGEQLRGLSSFGGPR